MMAEKKDRTNILLNQAFRRIDTHSDRLYEPKLGKTVIKAFLFILMLVVAGTLYSFL